MTVADHPVRQIAYFVTDVRAAAIRHAALFNSGPYFVAEHIPLRVARHRGQDAELDHSSAYGQWGALMIEFVQQNNPGPSVFRDLYGEGEEGMHHVALIVTDLAAARARFETAGMATALYAEMRSDGFPFVMIDAIEQYGHFIELYEGSPQLVGFYEMVRKASIGFEGRDPIREIGL